MPSTTEVLRRIQLGKEVTSGTPVAATERMLAAGELTPDYPLHRNQHPIGVMVEHTGGRELLKKDVNVRLTMNGVTYEQIGWPLSLCIDQPATSGVGPYEHIWAPGTANPWAPHSATLEFRYGDGTDNTDGEIEYVMGRSLRLSGEQGAQLNLEADLFGRQVTAAAVTSLSVLATLTPITMATAAVYMSDTFALADVGPPAAGIVSNQLLSFDLEIDTGIFPKHTIQNSLTFGEHKERVKGFRLRLRQLWNADATGEGAAAERVHAQAGDLRFVTLYFLGPGNLDMRIVLVGVHEMGDFLTVGEQDGLDTTEMIIIGHYDPTGATLVKFLMNNDDADPL